MVPSSNEATSGLRELAQFLEHVHPPCRFRECPGGAQIPVTPGPPQWGPGGPHCLGGFARVGQARSLVDGADLREWLSE